MPSVSKSAGILDEIVNCPLSVLKENTVVIYYIVKAVQGFCSIANVWVDVIGLHLYLPSVIYLITLLLYTKLLIVINK